MAGSFFEVFVKKMLCCLVLFAGLAFFPAPAGAAGAEELHLYCGAGLRQPVQQLLKSFQKEIGLKVAVEYAGSGQLMARYLASHLGDVLLPGSHFYVEKLAKLGEVTWSRQVVLHVPVVGFPKKSAGKVMSFSDLAKPGMRVGLGDPKAMALGRTAEDILKNSGIAEEVKKNVVVRAATVKQLTMYVIKGDVDAGIIARADVFQKKDKLGMIEIDPSWYKPEIVTAACLKASAQPKSARKLAEYLSSAKAVETFGKYGFLPVK